MKLFIVMLLVLSMAGLQAQFTESHGMIKGGAGYTHDFPGLNGYTLAAEYSFPVIGHLLGGIGLKHADMQGYPRSSQAFEFTRATTLDFNLYYAPLRTETQLLRIGLGYSFSSYNIQRAYPIIVDHSNGKSITWPTQQSKGVATGINLIAEYEIKIPNTNFSLGARGAMYKAYNMTYFFGTMLGHVF
jgi:hypothetical protein